MNKSTFRKNLKLALFVVSGFLIVCGLLLFIVKAQNNRYSSVNMGDSGWFEHEAANMNMSFVASAFLMVGIFLLVSTLMYIASKKKNQDTIITETKVNQDFDLPKKEGKKEEFVVLECPHCGATNIGNSKFCPYCDSKLS